MARLVGFIGNRPDLGARALAVEEAAMMVHSEPSHATLPKETAAKGDEPPEGATSWGIGFYQGGEILLKRRPFDDRTVLNFADLVRDVKADVLVGHVRAATVGTLRTENTHPFRYRQWLYAQTGTVTRFDTLHPRLRESLPQFLARDVRGDTDAELVFYLFLSFLHDVGKLDRAEVDPAIARQAVRSAVSLVDQLCAEEGHGPPRLNIMIACGDYLIGVHTGAAMGYHLLSGRAALERLFGGESFTRTKIPHLTSAWLGLCASDFDEDRVPAGWRSVPDRATVTLAHGHEPHVQAL